MNLSVLSALSGEFFFFGIKVVDGRDRPDHKP
jgi:hypothetical protein